MADKNVKIKITSAIAVSGDIVKPGKVIEAPESVAKNLLERGRAELVTKEASGPNYSKMNVAALKDLAAELDIEGFDDMNKAALIEAIEAAAAV